MSLEFNIDTFLEQNMPDKKDMPIAVVLTYQHATCLGLFLMAQVSLRQKRFKAGEIDPSERIHDLEDNIAVLAEKIDQAIGEVYEPKVYLDVSRRELDDLGYGLLTNSSILSKTKFTKAFRKPVFDSFLVLDREFVGSGGLENSELRYEMEGMLKAIK